MERLNNIFSTFSTVPVSSKPPVRSQNNPFVDDAEPEQHSYDYDLIVIGGGSGGLAAAKEAAELGARVALLDLVKASPAGTTWGLGGTCVNVGCIPKKLMHQAALLGEAIDDASAFGWEIEGQKKKHQWETLVGAVQDHVHSLNFGYRVALRQKSVNYVNSYGVFVDPHTIEAIDKKGAKKTMTARRFLIATGGRPKYPELPGIELAISSDDLFSLKKAPGKTLVVGASYVALECAGFLTGLGYEVSLMVRSIFLRGFDQQMGDLVGNYMASHGTRILRPSTPTKLEKTPDGSRILVSYLLEKETKSEEFDTVLFAVGREAEVKAIGLDKAGVVVDAASGKLVTDNERTNVPHIYAVGDILKGKPELTPVAIQAGRLLARRLYGGGRTPMDYINVPTTVFTPLEYGCCGLSEEEALEKYGDKLEVYHSNFTPLEWTVPHRPENVCYAKLLVNTADNQRVVGFHVLGPHAGEITQGFGVAMKCGATKEHFDQTIGIHPTQAEEFTILSITKSSGEDTTKGGC